MKGAKVEVAQAGAWCAVDSQDGKWLTKVLRRPDGRWQVWPAWGQSPFPRIAETTLAASEHLHQAVGGDLQFSDCACSGSGSSQTEVARPTNVTLQFLEISVIAAWLQLEWTLDSVSAELDVRVTNAKGRSDSTALIPVLEDCPDARLGSRGSTRSSRPPLA